MEKAKNKFPRVFFQESGHAESLQPLTVTTQKQYCPPGRLIRDSAPRVYNPGLVTEVPCLAHTKIPQSQSNLVQTV